MKKEGKYKIDLMLKHVDGEIVIPYVDKNDLRRDIGEMLPEGFFLGIERSVDKVLRWVWIQVNSETFSSAKLNEEARPIKSPMG